MKHLLYLALLTSLVFSFASCSKSNDNTWQTKNTAAYNAKASDNSYVAVTLPSYSKPPLYCKVLKKGTGTVHPYYTSLVEFLYKGSLIDSTLVFTGTSTSDVPIQRYINNLYVSSSSTVFLPVGVGIALQNMVAGDKWEVWIPQELAYGSSSTTAIPAYSTLVFEIELVSIKQQ